MGTIQESHAEPPSEEVQPPESNTEINSNTKDTSNDNILNNNNEVPTVCDDSGDGCGGGGDTVISDPPPLTDSNFNDNNKDCDDLNITCKSSVPQKTSGVSPMSRIARPCVGHQKPAVPQTPTQNNSVLTEDTDSFIIGDKVWVGGTKPGQIAYIGETQFAPGEWAGIVLDHPIGKNDGSVGGMRYFQCEQKRGVFSRLSRLTRLPFPEADESIYRGTSAPVNNGARQRGGSPLSPTGSTKSLRKSPSLSASNTSLSSTTHVVDFKIGDRVIIKSSQGSKVGTLRFMGTTSFAQGEWCGVELDEPRGKNDGSVGDLRYFECRPLFGLFAPISKVSKSPLKYKPGNCVVHTGAGLPPSGMKRMGSKESMTSMTSSITSATSNARRVRLGVNSLTPQKVTTKSTTNNFPSRTALQDVLREKQQHIEQLLKERDLENAEFTRAANHAEHAEKQFTTLKAEYEYYRTECETKLKEFASVLSHLNVDRDSLLSQLDDEKRRNEDLQFRFEEVAITKGDIEVSNQTNVHRIRDLEIQLSLERRKIEQLEVDSGKLFEAEEALVKSREEIDHLRQDLRKRDILQQEVLSSAESSVHLKRELESRTQKVDDLSVNCEVQQQEIINLRLELSQVKDQLQEKSVAFENKIREDAIRENSLRDELERVKAELSAKNTEVQAKDEALQLKAEEIRSMKALLETTQIDLNAKSVDIERYQQSKQDSELAFNKEIDSLKKTLKEKTVEREEIEKTCSVQTTQKNAQLEDASRTINHHLEEIERLKSDLSEAKTDIERNSADVHERHTRQIAIKESELMTLAAELQLKSEELTKFTIVSTKLEDDICVKNGIIDQLRMELETIKKHSEAEQLTRENYTERNSALQLTVGDYQRKLTSTEQLVAELQEQKLRLENEMQGIISSRGDYTSEMQKLNAAVLEKEQVIATVRSEFTQKLQISQSIEQQQKLELQKVNEDFERAVLTLEEKLKTAQQTEQMVLTRSSNANAEAIKIREELMLKVDQLQRSLEDKEFALKAATSETSENKRYITEQLERTTGELQRTINGCQTRINELVNENMSSRDAFTKKSEELIECEAKLKHFISQSQLNEAEIRRVSEEQVKNLQFDLAEKSAQVNLFMQELELLKRDCQNRNLNIGEKDHRISELSDQLERTSQLVIQLETNKDNLQLKQMEASKQWALSNQQCTNLVTQVALLSEKVELSDKLAKELQMQKTVHQKLLQQLQITEEQKQDLIVHLEGEVNRNGDAGKCSYMLELVKNLQASATDSYTKKINELQQTIESTGLTLRESQLQVETHKEEILRLQNEMLKIQQVSGTIHQGFPVSSLDTHSKLAKYPEDHNRLLEEKQQAEGQIQFLNSIIVDIQRKNEDQRARIEMLESGFSPSAVSDLNLFGQVQQQRQTRMYCDICEVFDKHETEDCPIQANVHDGVLPRNFRSKRATSSERPYCEICEVFGHCTEDCKEDETF